MGTKEAYHEKLDAQLRDWSAQIDQLKAKADKATAEAKIEYYKQLEELQPKREAAKLKLQEIKNSSEAAWEHLKIGAEKAVEDLKISYEKAKLRFEK